MMIKIKNTASGNCGCGNCGRYQEGMKNHPFTVWMKKDNEKRGHNIPVCSEKCAKEYIEKVTKGEGTMKENEIRMDYKVADKWMDNDYKWHITVYECKDREIANSLSDRLSHNRNYEVNNEIIKDYQIEVSENK